MINKALIQAKILKIMHFENKYLFLLQIGKQYPAKTRENLQIQWATIGQ